jgi:hypothetical protein
MIFVIILTVMQIIIEVNDRPTRSVKYRDIFFQYIDLFIIDKVRR